MAEDKPLSQMTTEELEEMRNKMIGGLRSGLCESENDRFLEELIRHMEAPDWLEYLKDLFRPSDECLDELYSEWEEDQLSQESC
jgi:hypothetical protein